MGPPKFADLSKSVNDLFKDDFGSGSSKVTFKAKTASGADLKIEGSKSGADGAVSAYVQTKFTHNKIAVQEKLTSKNTLETEITASKLAKGVKVVVANTYNPAKGISGLKLKADYSADQFTFNSATTPKAVDVGAVYAHGKYLLGASAVLSTAGSLDSTAFGLAYSESDLKLSSTIKNGSNVEGCVYHAPSAGVQTGVKVGWDASKSACSFSAATKYKLDADSFVKAKVNDKLSCDLSYTTAVKPGVKLGLFGKINLNSLTADAHSLGWALTFSS